METNRSAKSCALYTALSCYYYLFHTLKTNTTFALQTHQIIPIMAYRLLDSRLPRNLLQPAISSKADVGVLDRNLQLQECEQKTSATGFIRPHCAFSVTDSDILVAAMGLLEAEATSSQETCQCQGRLREQVATDLPLNNPSSSLMFQPGTRLYYFQ